MSDLDDLLSRLADSDPDLAESIERATAAAIATKPCGLVWESLPEEIIDLPTKTVCAGDEVVILDERAEDDHPDTRYVVEGVDGDIAHLVEPISGARLDQDVSDLMVSQPASTPILPVLERMDDVPGQGALHTVICGENLHGLQMLARTHAGSVDAIYIDPPYNSGARDWKYNNHFTSPDATWRHSAWIESIHQRLLLAKKILNPDCSVLIVAIDEKEYLNLGMLLRQMFPEATISMVSSLTNPKGTGRRRDFSRTDEYIYFVRLGTMTPAPVASGEVVRTAVHWQGLRRPNAANTRDKTKTQFYAIYVNASGEIVGRSDSLGLDHDIHAHQAPEGTVAVFPIRPSGKEMMWGLTPASFDERLASGYIKVTAMTPEDPQKARIVYLMSGAIADLESGRARWESDGSAWYVGAKKSMPTTHWSIPSHNAHHHGTLLLGRLLPDRTFPYPKSLYAVEDALRIFLADRPEATVVDFYAGSGTTAHAVARLNAEDDGARRSISISNNEVSGSEAREMTAAGLRQTDSAWQARGICEHVTFPRVRAALTGIDSTGAQVVGNYRYNLVSSMSEGLPGSAVFYRLGYASASEIDSGTRDDDIAAVLRMCCDREVSGDAETRRKDYLEIFST